MIFEVGPEQVVSLDSGILVRLMKRLMQAECRLLEIPLRSTLAPLQITVPDGGEDGRVEWRGGTDQTDFFPARFCILQAKAQNLTDVSVTSEVLKRKGRKSILSDALKEVLANQGAYIIFCS